MGRRDVNMLSGSIVKGLMTISIPIMVMNVIQSLFSIIDMTILKSYDAGGGIAVGAVGVCSTLITTITGLVIGISSGANVVIADGTENYLTVDNEDVLNAVFGIFKERFADFFTFED